MTFHPAAPPHELHTQTHTALAENPLPTYFFVLYVHVQDPRYDFFYDAHSATARCSLGKDEAPFAVVGSS